MKIIYYIIITTTIAITIQTKVNAQEFNKVYYNSNWVVTSIDSATYYRMSEFNAQIPSFDGLTTDYYLNNNQIEMIGFYENGNKNGEFNFYYPNGKLRMVINYNNNNKIGSWKEFFQNGKVKTNVIYQDNVEKLLELNDSIGNSLLEKNNVKYTYYPKNLPGPSSNLNSLEKEEIIEIKGKIVNNLREGKWTVKKNRKQYASITYKQGTIIKGYFLTNDYLGRQKNKLTNNLAFPLIEDPSKFIITEKFFLEPGTLIKNNYLTEGLNLYNSKSKEKVIISKYDDLVQFIKENFSIQSSKFEKIKINLKITNGIITEVSTDPKLSNNSMNYLKLIIGTIEKIEFITDNVLVIEYNVENK
jgi:antitoxin component YwqK of YwqJK toxin-antitoxin module